MIELYLVVSALTTATPKITAYQSEQQACIEVEGMADNHLYKETLDKKGENVSIVEGVCRPVKQFVTK